MASIALSGTGSDSAVGGSRSTSKGRFARVGAATVAAATLANVAFYFVADPFVAYTEEFKVLANLGGTVSFTLVAAVIAVLVYAALLRWARNPVKTFQIVSAVVLVVTAIPDFTYLPGVDGSSNAQIAVLLTMHLIAAVVIVAMLTKLARPAKG